MPDLKQSASRGIVMRNQINFGMDCYQIDASSNVIFEDNYCLGINLFSRGSGTLARLNEIQWNWTFWHIVDNAFSHTVNVAVLFLALLSAVRSCRFDVRRSRRHGCFLCTQYREVCFWW